ncbi:LysR family transcriptional regulator [Marinomonas sp. 15G1-11]|uniref:LysR family transcriptional regulator n=1 Tax=Marinomonas phaeophyticola TaxID=3004091 RepID=A0ABT4JZR6_9GAMM|nr:LysR family transcriptional regulator [Marinomonas sp. 15G1-11]MCZ2723721.1 LysR family transcriptional regulator [Marinomonas sp. 15G1-11]
MDTFSAIPVFVAVVENGSFSKAAEALGTSKSAVSKRISLLENTLGVKLLHRTTRRLSLTEAGEHYFQHAHKAIAAATEGIDAVTQLQGKPKGILKVSTPMSFGRLHLAPLVTDFLNHYPEIKLNIIMDDKKIDLVENGFDVAIRAGDMQDSTLVARRLASCRSVVCASPAYLKRHGTPSSPDELTQHNCIRFAYDHYGNEWVFKKQNQCKKIKVNGNYQVNNSEALQTAALAGLGIAKIPTFVIGQDLSKKQLIPLFEEYTLPMQTFYAVFPERRHLPAKVRVFLDFIIEKLASDHPYWEINHHTR